jgi:FkbM family methyltransferase
MLPRVNLVRTDSVDYLLFSTRDAISSTIYSTGQWANLLVDIGVFFCSDIEQPFVLDVGANLGAYSIPLAKRLVADALVYSFEPQRIIYYQLCGNIFLNRLENIHAFNMAVGSEAGFIDLQNIDYHTSANIGAASVKYLTDEAKNAEIGVTGMTKVAMTTLDSLSLPRIPTLVKIDVEGFELEVLKGAGTMLRDAGYPPMLLEAWSDPAQAAEKQALLNEIESLGYTIFPIMDEIIAQHPDHPRQFTFHVNEHAGLSMVRTR